MVDRFGGTPLDQETGISTDRFGGTEIVEDAPEAVQEASPIAAPISELVPEAVSKVSDIAASAAPEAGVMDFFTGSERIAATPELGTAPEFALTPEADSLAAALEGGDTETANKISLGLISTFDPKAQIEMIQDAIPEAVFETTPDGSTIIEVPTASGGTRRSVLNRPGLSAQDIRSGLAQLLAFIPSTKAAALGQTLLKKIGIGAVTAGATEQALQEGGIEFLGRKSRDPAATAFAAGAGGLAEAVVPAVQAIRQTKQAAKIGAASDELAQVAPAVQAGQEASEATGIPLFQAQQTTIPAQLEKQSFVAQLPAGTQSAVKGLKAQNQAAGDAVESFLESIAPPEAVVTGAERFRGAARAAVDKAKNIRAEKASPLYKQAFLEGAEVDVSPVNEFIKAELKDLPAKGEISKSLNKVSDLVKGNPSLKLLHNVKLEIDQMLNKFGSDSLGNTTKAKVTEAKNILISQIDEASPSYKAARDAFADASPEVTKVSDSIIGKIANLDDTQLKQVSGMIFDPAQTNPQVIVRAKKAIMDVDPRAWNELIRVELEKRLGLLKPKGDDFNVANVPGQMYRALFPNDKGTKVLFNALNSEQKKNLKFLQTALGRAKEGRPGGSQTAAREEIKKELRGGAVQSVREFFKAPISTLISTGDEAAFNRRAAALSKALFDSTWKAEMKQLRVLNPNSPAAARAMTQLLNDIENTEGEQ